MTHLQRKALARTALAATDVENLYAMATPYGAFSLPAVEVGRLKRIVRDLCESHERLRAEAEGLMVLYEEAKAKLRELGVDA